jgi:hypothetical protein
MQEKRILALPILFSATTAAAQSAAFFPEI